MHVITSAVSNAVAGYHELFAAWTAMMCLVLGLDLPWTVSCNHWRSLDAILLCSSSVHQSYMLLLFSKSMLSCSISLAVF